MNGTPSGVKNCFEGGCERCNNPNINKGQNLDECLCIHAEENSLLQADIGNIQGSVIYCTSLPCLGCLKKLVQCKIKKIFYRDEYIRNEAYASLLKLSKIEYEKIEIKNFLKVFSE